MFSNLEAEMARVKMTKYRLAEILKITPTTMSLKLNGKSELSLRECIEIKKAINSDCSIEYLFEIEK